MPLFGHVGRYAVLRAIDGDTHCLAFDPQLDRTVVLELADEDRAAPLLERARSFANLQHAALPTIHEVAMIERRAVVARAHVVGRPILAWAALAGDVDRIVRAFAAVADAMAIVHGAGLVLGGLDSAGIVVAADDRPAVVAPLRRPSGGTPADDRRSLLALLHQALAVARVVAPAWLRSLGHGDGESTDAIARVLGRDRSGRRRAAWVALAGTGVAALVGATYLRTRAAADPACRDAERKLAGVWDAAASERVRAAMLATKVTYAPAVAESVLEQLDARAAAWVDAHTAACEARRHASSTEAELGARMRCLDGVRAATGELVDVLAAADATGVRNAVRTVGVLEDPWTCLEPSDEAEAEPAERPEHRRRLSRARALSRAGDHAAAREILGDVLESAAGDARVTAEAYEVLALLQRDLGDAEGADAALVDCVAAAWRAGDHELAALAWSHAIFVRAELLGDNASAHEAVAMAQASAARVGSPPSLQLAIHHSAGTLAFREGRYRDATVEYDAALGLVGADEGRRAQLLTNLANAQARTNDGVLAEANLAEALVIHRRMLGDVHPTTALTRESLGAVLLVLDRPEAALPHLEDVLRIREATLGPTHPLTIRAVGSIGAALIDLRRWADARATIERARSLAVAHLDAGDRDIAFFLTNLGVIARAQHDPARAREVCREAQTFRGVLSDPDLAGAIHCEGMALADLGEHEAAVERLGAALELRRRALGDDHELLARTWTGIGASLRVLGRLDPALDALRRAAAILERRGTPPSMRAATEFELGRALWDAGRREEGHALVEQAAAGYRARPLERDPAAEVAAWLAEHPHPA